jgi:hypothetical protein
MATGNKPTPASADKPTTDEKPRAQVAKQGTGVTNPAPLVENAANPEGKPDVSTGPVGDTDVIDAQEHVLGDDPRRVKAQLEGGFHDSLTGAPVDAEGNFVEASRAGQGPVPKHRIVADAWPTEREKLDDPAQRLGNEAV